MGAVFYRHSTNQHKIRIIFRETNISKMVLISPIKKPRLEICQYKYKHCTGHHQILPKCHDHKCGNNHQNLNGIQKQTTRPNQYLRYALNRSLKLRHAREKLQKAQDNLFKQLMKNSENFHKNNPYTSVPNLSQYEMEQDEFNSNEESQNNYASIPKQSENNYASVPKQSENNYASIPKQSQNNYASIPKQSEKNYASISKQPQKSSAFIPKQNENKHTFVPKESENNYAFIPMQSEKNYAFSPKKSQKSSTFTPNQSENNNSFITKQPVKNHAFVPTRSQEEYAFVPKQSEKISTFPPKVSDNKYDFTPKQSHMQCSKQYDTLDLNAMKNTILYCLLTN